MIEILVKAIGSFLNSRENFVPLIIELMVVFIFRIHCVANINQTDSSLKIIVQSKIFFDDLNSLFTVFCLDKLFIKAVNLLNDGFFV